MGQQHTKDERFVISLYELARQANDLEASFNRYDVGQRVNLQERGVDAICKLLVQSNFIKKDGEEGIFLMPRGITLAERLLNE